MSDINLVVQKALFAQLKNNPALLNAQPVPVYAYAPSSAKAPYILLEQVSTVPLNGAAACRVWESVFQITIITNFTNTGDDTPSLLIQGQVVEALDNVQLVLEDNYQIHPVKIDQTSKSSRYDSNCLEVLRYIRLKMRVYKNK